MHAAYAQPLHDFKPLLRCLRLLLSGEDHGQRMAPLSKRVLTDPAFLQVLHKNMRVMPC